jgi:hypothetical protein
LTLVEDIRETRKPQKPQTPNQRGKWEKERRRTEERGGEPKGAPTPLSSSVKTHEFIARRL